ncbi:hypothetical protein [Caproiciproducens sp.]
MTQEEILQKRKNYLRTHPIYYIEHFMNICDKNGAIVPFKLNSEQRDYMEHKGKRNIIMKSRQIGMSSVIAANSLFLACTHSNYHCLMAADSDADRDSIFDKLKQLYEYMNPNIKPKLINNSKTKLRFENGSQITCQTLGPKGNAGRSTTLQFCHISEFGMMQDDNVARNHLAAITSALTSNAELVIESTAKGVNTFSNMYFAAERNDGSSIFKAFFFPWYEDHQMFEGFYEKAIDQYKQQYGKYLTKEELTPYELNLYKKGMTLKQAMWARLTRIEKGLSLFKQEFPATSLEAVLTTGDSLFDKEKVQQHLNADKIMKPIKNKPNNLPSILVPYFNKELTIWELPKPNEKFWLGVDCSEGLGGKRDYSVVEIIDKNDRQVAEFKSNKVKSYDFADIVLYLGIYFNRGMLIIEKASTGHYLLDKLYHDCGYQNMYFHMEYDANGKGTPKVGFDTNPKTKPIMIDNFNELFSRNQMVINSDYLLNEMQVFVVKDGKMGAMEGYHDDAILSMSLALQGRTWQYRTGWKERIKNGNK